jgi:cytochrome c oxidase subunit 2
MLRFRTPAHRRLRRAAPLVCALALAALAAGCSGDLSQYPQSALDPKGDFARLTDGLFTTVVWWAVLVFVLVEGALLYAIFKFRGKPGDAEPAQVHGNTVLEIVWTMIPAIVLAMIAVPTVKAIFKTNEIPTDNPLTIEVIGHQWWWEFRYPEYGITTANQLHVPVGRTVSLRMGTVDVLHSFWVPQYAGKRDVFPNRETRLWFKAEEGGFYPGQCAEFCGIQHGKMAFWIAAQPADSFDLFVKSMQATRAVGPNGAPMAAPASSGATVAQAAQQGEAQRPQAQDPAKAGQEGAGMDPRPAQGVPSADSAAAGADAQVLAQGRQLFTAKGCVGCHSMSAVNAPKGMIGPNLAGLGSRGYIAAGVIKNTDEKLAQWLRQPQALKEGVLMPNGLVTEAEAQQLVAYFRALAQQTPSASQPQQ